MPPPTSLDDASLRDRALRIVTRVVHDLARGNEWRIPEHFDDALDAGPRLQRRRARRTRSARTAPPSATGSSGRGWPCTCAPRSAPAPRPGCSTTRVELFDALGARGLGGRRCRRVRLHRRLGRPAGRPRADALGRRRGHRDAPPPCTPRPGTRRTPTWYETWWQHVADHFVDRAAARGGTSFAGQPAQRRHLERQARHLPRVPGHPVPAAPALPHACGGTRSRLARLKPETRAPRTPTATRRRSSLSRPPLTALRMSPGFAGSGREAAFAPQPPTASRSPVRAISSSNACARSATGFCPFRPASSTSAQRSAARACSSAERLSSHQRSAYVVRTAYAKAGARSNRSRLPRSVYGIAGVGELPVEERADVERVRVEDQVLGVEVAVHEAAAADPVEPLLSSGGDVHQAGPVLRREPRQLGVRDVPGKVVGLPEAPDPQVAVHERAAPEHRHPGQHRQQLTEVRPQTSQPLVVQGRDQLVAAHPVDVRRDQQRGSAGGGIRAAYLQHLGHGHQPAHQLEQRRVDLVRRRRPGGRARRRSGRRSAPPPRRPGTSAPTSHPSSGSARQDRARTRGPCSHARQGRTRPAAPCPATSLLRVHEHPPGPGRTAAGRRGRVPAGERPRLGPVRRRVPGHPRRVPRRRRLRLGSRGPDRGTRRACSATSPGRTFSRSGPAPASARAG